MEYLRDYRKKNLKKVNKVEKQINRKTEKYTEQAFWLVRLTGATRTCGPQYIEIIDTRMCGPQMRV